MGSCKAPHLLDFSLLHPPPSPQFPGRSSPPHHYSSTVLAVLSCHGSALRWQQGRVRAAAAAAAFPDAPAITAPRATYAPDELPVDEEFLTKFAPKENESEEEARRRNWVERGWAPWEEILTPEGDFARKSLNEGEEVPLQSPEAIEAFKMLSPHSQMAKNPPDPQEPTLWDGPLALRMVPPRDWPPRGWTVDKDELAFIREAHKLECDRVDLESEVRTDVDSASLERYKVFMKQYTEWAVANRDRLEDEAYELHIEGNCATYYLAIHFNLLNVHAVGPRLLSGRRKRGKDYKDDMLELPFFYPGQVSIHVYHDSLHLQQGAFVDVGCVHDGWVPIKGNDWYWIRHTKVGMQVIAKRDPYRFRFPLEMRFVDPNIDHLMYVAFPPIFHREEDKNPEELWRDAGRPPIPRKNPGYKIEEQALLSNHPYVDKLWQLHVSEQMILDDEEKNPDKYKDKEFLESFFNAPYDEEHSIEHTEVYYKKSWLPKTILKTNVRELDLDAARAERQLNNRLKNEARERGEEYKSPKTRRMIEMDEYDFLHWRRSLEEREALIRDISVRRLEEPGRYLDDSVLGKEYDPTSPLKQVRMTEDHNRSIVGKGNVWYDMPYEEAIKQQTRGEGSSRRDALRENTEQGAEEEEEEDDDDDGLDFDYEILGDSSSVSAAGKPFVNGTESPGVSDEGMFED
ncbi:unnamed protein product [Spirodela intermedia]|uniref:Uncharacterized protein n=1 Tax=Spirodela intermedia TaxID=51605 RepID=A0A7I8IPD4_SPIIN|nr:unnamed protein product [Spirodela intermedia]CAA6659659.1 unnamed protein product [Spirodela intermedia]